MNMLLGKTIKCLSSARTLGRRQEGATMIEYALIIAVVSIALVVLAGTLFDGSLEAVGTAVSDAITTPNSGSD